ncbi:polyhydroxybutyrate depolymerase, partial [Mycobacterium kansasii]|uniref:alpha/beta hydrolase family esterase n=1 Tax=Mycobacterium kansasii TaxID=1768 RepID=UPI000D433781
MVRRLVMLLGVVGMLVGCAHAPAPPPVGFGNGTSFHTIDVGGVQRSYRLYKPAGLPRAAPLVVMLHGGFGSARQAERSYDWDELADSEKFVVAYPDGLNRAWNANGGGCCGRSAREGVDDVAFVNAAVAAVRDTASST